MEAIDKRTGYSTRSYDVLKDAVESWKKVEHKCRVIIDRISHKSDDIIDVLEKIKKRI